MRLCEDLADVEDDIEEMQKVAENMRKLKGKEKMQY